MTLSTTAKPFTVNLYPQTTATNRERRACIDVGHLKEKVQDACKDLTRAPGVHSRICMKTAGFMYTSNGDTVQCNFCNLTVSGWTSHMEPFAVHKERYPTCSYVQKMLSRSNTTGRMADNVEEPPCKRMKINENATSSSRTILTEVESLKQSQIRSFSHWPHRSSPSSAQMIQAGFFSCNVGDRVICIYCSLICQQWTPNVDDPCEVHKTLSPKCVYVTAMLIASSDSASPLSIINEASSMTNITSLDSHTIVHTAACNPNYIEIPKRYASFENWPSENAPSVDDLVKAGFFFTGTKTVVTCFYCNGSLQNWGGNDNPMIEHARWFPHCAYAKQLCGTELYQKIQESKKVLAESTRVNNSNGHSNTRNRSMDDGRLLIPDESTLSRLVAARLDLPVSQRLLDRNFKLSVIKRCWEDQLRLKHDDFKSDVDLFMACTILQKQIEKIDGNKENIIIPSIAMERSRAASRETSESTVRTTPINTTDTAHDTQSPPSTAMTFTSAHPISNENCPRTNTGHITHFDPCRLCSRNSWHLALLPCHHLPSAQFVNAVNSEQR